MKENKNSKVVLPREMQIKYVSPLELPRDMLYLLNNKFDTQLSEFIFIVDNVNQIMYVKHGVMEEDVNKFVDYICFPGPYVNDYDEGLGYLSDYIYNTYGENVYSILLHSHKYRQDIIAKQTAQKQAKKIMPLIEAESISDDSEKCFNEELVYEIQKTGRDSGRKTIGNLVNYGTKYVFYLGVLIGSGKIVFDRKGRLIKRK